jgi:hypothetical protein
VVDISREYDFTSDFPNRPLSPFYLLPIANAAAGLVTVHLDYEGVNVDDPANVVWQDGNTTYVLLPTPTLPLLAPLQILGSTRSGSTRSSSPWWTRLMTAPTGAG